MTGPPASTVFRFTNDEVCKVGSPENVGKELRKTWIWQEKVIHESDEALQLSDTDSARF